MDKFKAAEFNPSSLFYVGTDYFILLTFSMTIHFMIIYVSS